MPKTQFDKEYDRVKPFISNELILGSIPIIEIRMNGFPNLFRYTSDFLTLETAMDEGCKAIMNGNLKPMFVYRHFKTTLVFLGGNGTPSNRRQERLLSSTIHDMSKGFYLSNGSSVIPDSYGSFFDAQTVMICHEDMLLHYLRTHQDESEQEYARIVAAIELEKFGYEPIKVNSLLRKCTNINALKVYLATLGIDWDAMPDATKYGRIYYRRITPQDFVDENGKISTRKVVGIEIHDNVHRFKRQERILQLLLRTAIDGTVGKTDSAPYIVKGLSL